MGERERYVKAIVYDLPSENLRNITNEDIKDMIRSTRVYSVQLLHSIGVQCTESVILISPSNVNKIETIVRRVRERYNVLFERLRELGIELRSRVIIEVLDLTTEHYNRLMPIAKQNLLRALDEAIDRASRVLNEIEQIIAENRVRKARSSLRRLKRNWNNIYRIARELGIDITGDYEYLVELVEEGLRRLE